ncbi:hypothetical protein RM543_13015 [Roseicyclus sp. F158]|uniref:Uncharacterized protein n=1 Tax=Tropicimonas omnivorans TaxID=3075590 RepID=A0ABU3DJA1_9RHOB|nr:hypothetical protein [Roseicyclus sp. F158]MDT0683609.1 hypothetical protein [Roseicyclus sp. F158]
MDIDEGTGGSEDPAEELARASIRFRSHAKELTEIVREIDAGNTDRARRLGSAIAEIRRAAGLLDELARYTAAKDTRSKGGMNEATCGTVDLADVREEIGRRLDRLKGERPGSGVSREPER